MTTAATNYRAKPETTASRIYSPGAAVLSFLVPGLGQICQGRTGKGLLFLVSLYTLFFGGMYLADWRNVYIPEPVRNEPKSRWPDFMVNISNRLQYAGQFWIGIAAWPAIWQYNHLPVPSMETSPFWHRFQKAPPEQADGSPEWDGISLNQLQRDSDKTWDLAWVYTVIAGVLNILVIYDAFAGPAFVTAEGKAGARLERVPA